MLWKLCEDGELVKVRAALARGENVNSSQPVFGISALMWTVREKHNSIVKVLMKQPNLDVNMRDGMGLTALHWAATHYNAAAVPLLLADPRVNVNCKSNIGRNALFCAALYGNVEAVRFLLTDQRSDVNNVDKDGLTLLHAASCEDSAEVARLLLAEGRINDVNHLDKEGESLLMVAVKEKRGKTVRKLGAHQNVDLDTRDRRGRTVEEVARWCRATPLTETNFLILRANGHTQLLNILEKARAVKAGRKAAEVDNKIS